METPDSKLARLLHNAAGVADDRANDLPLGFDTRMVALWRSSRAGEWSDFSRFLRRVTVLSAAIMLVSSVFAVRQLSDDENDEDSSWNAYAIADNAIQTELPQ